jgi:molybdopterin/thiamine biosynthesis adenylyltransferase
MALEESHILLINSGSGVVGIETLKNLVLPGIGNFTIQDSAVVSEADLGVNFFLEEEHLGGLRAEHTCNSLKELNPDVQGNFVTEAGQPHCSATRMLTFNAAYRVVAHTTRFSKAVYSYHCSRPDST